MKDPILLVSVYLECIVGASGMGMGGIPSGHLYAMLMSVVDLDTHQKVVSFLEEQGMITMKNHLLRATDKGKLLYAKIEAITKAKV